jgi:catechol 2,3-dioxygenase-like lactoylglutathione lyase family enzyme
MTIDATFSVVGLVVSDMATTLAFYRRLGLGIPAAADTEPHVEVELPGGLKLAFDTEATIRSFHPDWTPPKDGGRVGLAFAVPDPAGVDALHAELVGAGHRSELAPFDAFWGQRYATVLDPDGTGVDLFATSAG